MNFSKSDLLQQLKELLSAEAAILQRSVESAAEAATHPEAKPENKYDTRGLEASYLAGAQQERLAELKGALVLLQNLQLRSFNPDDAIAVTALVALEQEGEEAWYFLLAVGAGYKLQEGDKVVMTITPHAPVGKALLHKHVGDSFTLKTGRGPRSFEIIAIQ